MELEKARLAHAKVVDETQELSTKLDESVNELVEAEKGLKGDWNRKDLHMQVYLNAYAQWQRIHTEWYARVMPTKIELHRLEYEDNQAV